MEEWKKIFRLSSFFAVNFIAKELIDWGLNSFLMYELHYWLSTLITTTIYLIIGFTTVKLYDDKKRDSFGFEALKINREESDNQNNLGQLVVKIIKTGFLFYLKNAGLFVIYFRKGSNLYDGFADKNMRRFFIIYLVLINILWNILVYLGVSAIEIILGVPSKI